MTLFWNELHWYKFCAEASLFQSDYIPSDSPPTASPPCLASGLRQSRFVFYLHEPYCSTSILTRCHRAAYVPRGNRFRSFAFLLAWHPSCSFPPPALFHSITDPVGMPCPRISQGFFLCQRKSTSSPHWISQYFAVTYQSLGQSVQGESNCGHKGHHPTTSREHRRHCCNTRVLSYCSLYLKFCAWFGKVISKYK